MIVHARHANNSHNNISSAVPESPPPQWYGGPPKPRIAAKCAGSTSGVSVCRFRAGLNCMLII